MENDTMQKWSYTAVFLICKSKPENWESSRSATVRRAAPTQQKQSFPTENPLALQGADRKFGAFFGKINALDYKLRLTFSVI